MTLAQEAPPVLIAALSGRALAACARRGGYRPLVADLFADLDTREMAEANERVPGSLTRGFVHAALMQSLDRLAAGRQVMGVVTGSGFEDRPRLLQSIAARHVLLGNRTEVVAAVKDPFRFAELCHQAGVPHPEIRRDRPGEGDWLSKRTGGSGGTHIAATAGRAGPRRYYQRRLPGEAVSAAFLAAGGACRVLGLSRQWADPAPRLQFRYGGAVRPASVAPALAAAIADALARLVQEVDLRGLNSADFLLHEAELHLLEVNPRPSATLDIFTDPAVFRLHLEACRGVLPNAAPASPGAAAAATVYARADVCLPADFAWPEWAADRQPPGETVPEGAPLCTVLAEAVDAEAAERLVKNRAAEILARAEGGE